MNTLLNTLTYSMLLLVMLPNALQAQAIADSEGNYYRNETDVQATSRFSKLSSGSLWRVVVDELNCRQDKSIFSPVNRTYRANALLEVEVYRGGSDEVHVNPLDLYGKPWMPVRGKDSEDVCYVRANSRFIQPATLN
jgi:hypothetical protein